MSSVAVIGGSGFIGSAIANGLSAAGHEVTILDIRPPQGTRRYRYRSFDLVHPDSDLIGSECSAKNAKAAPKTHGGST